MSNKQFILKTFKKEFNEYFSFIKQNFTFEKSEIRYFDNIVNMFVKYGGTKSIEVWFTYFTVPYGKCILEGNLDYFIDKDYNHDIKVFELEQNIEYILKVINQTKEELIALDKDKKDICVDYLQKLTKMSIMYFK